MLLTGNYENLKELTLRCDPMVIENFWDRLSYYNDCSKYFLNWLFEEL